jgi:CRISPR-associated protein Csb2
MWVGDANLDVEPTLVPAEEGWDVTLRQAPAGALAYLRQEYNGEAVETFVRLSTVITTSRGKAQQEAKGEFRRLLGFDWKNSLQPPLSRRPVLGVSQGYRWVTTRRAEPAEEGIFDSVLLVMRLEPKDSRYRQLDLATTLRLTDVLRRAVLQVALEELKLENVPEVLSGHRADGRPAEVPHVAYLPMAFLGHPRADGHLLGVAVALPHERHWPGAREERAIVLAALARVRELTLGPLGVWSLIPELRKAPPSGLLPGPWTGYPGGQRLWASVTPVVFETHPKERDRRLYEQAVTAMVREACTRVGLPKPSGVRLTSISAHAGAPSGPEFPRLRRKDGSERRHAHVILEFPRPVIGPVLVGAGRYRGYGACRPLAHPDRHSGQ